MLPFLKKGSAKKLQNSVYWLMENEKSQSFLVLFYKKEQESFHLYEEANRVTDDAPNQPATTSNAPVNLYGLGDILRDSAAFAALLDQLHAAGSATASVPRPARPYLIGALAAVWPAPVVVITGRIKRAYTIAEQLPVWLPADDARPLSRFSEPAPQFYERAAWGDDATRDRAETLAVLMDDDARALTVTSARALMQRTLPVADFRRHCLRLRRGERHRMDDLLARLLALGYVPETIVTASGQFSRRGGVLDVFPVASAAPIRVDFFDDEIDTLRYFDTATQRRHAEMLEDVLLTPAREALPALLAQAAPRINPAFDEDRAALEDGADFALAGYYLPYITPHPVSLLDYVPQGALVIVEDADEWRAVTDEIIENAEGRRAEYIADGRLSPDFPTPYVDGAMLADDLTRHTVLSLGRAAPDAPAALDGVFRPGGRWGGQVRRLLPDLRAMLTAGERLVVVTAQAARLKQLWQESAADFLPTSQTIAAPPAPASVTFVNGTLSEGWSARVPDSPALHLLTDAEIFGWSRPEPRRRVARQRRKTPESDYADWREGDFVVHVDHGVGAFGGLVHRTMDGTLREYLLVRYADSGAVYVPIHQADRLTKYIGADERPPELSKLGKPEWARIKGRVKKAVQEQAQELLTLYQARAKAAGHAFAPDDHWQNELEASFPYVETQDQLASVQQVKRDMEAPVPMDRLICGDVGYGKTEVALRAAFKAVMGGKQVALLVPTTVLAQQHHDTFRERLAPFPIKIEMLSRFRDKEAQSRALPRIASGDIDIVIGTHRLLSKDITFHDLGLVIIDEEQRFGVKHKEHFKALRTQVDVLTLTATPIPRTLYMSLTGVRDISMIQTPPEERLPVVTHVGAFDENLVRSAILRELERGGQVFIVHNRVQTIDTLRHRIQEIVPEARVLVGHGQMAERQLEAVMSAFARGQADVLIATTIIESGIDIPNANTLIIDRADYLGLAQLYQLRGRVGRSAQQGYAYLFHSRKLTDEASARLQTLAENTHLGAGFDIAMRDLEIRGAGDILSTRQTGQVSAVGLHLYTQMLSDSIRQLKTGASAAESDTATAAGIVIDLPLPAYIPDDWMPEIALRLQIYRRIGALTERAQVAALRDELADRFGLLPAAVDNMLYQIEVKLLAQAANATHIIARDDGIQIRLPYLGRVNRDVLAEHLGDDVEVSRVAVTFPRDDDELWRWRLLDLLGGLRLEATTPAGEM
ncbi:MAG: transcription-repair coupling factor [Anaerolineaceae bacterium]|nr:MAG: transcription-repair coupling factor [Anaerolineaceae bacterium]